MSRGLNPDAPKNKKVFVGKLKIYHRQAERRKGIK
jgi:hypothetical protein